MEGTWSPCSGSPCSSRAANPHLWKRLAQEPLWAALVSSPSIVPGALVAAAAAEQGSGSWWLQRRGGTWVQVPASVGAQRPEAQARPPTECRVSTRSQRPPHVALRLPFSAPCLPTQPCFPRAHPYPQVLSPSISPCSVLPLTVLVPFPNSSMRTSDCSVALFTAFATCWP